MKRKRLFGLLLAVVMLFSMAPALGSTAEAEVITAVTATMTGDPNEICQLGKPIAYPSFSTSSGNTAEVVSESATWERNGSSVGSGVFTEGSWLLWVPVVVDGAAHPSDSLSDSVTLTVNGQPWVLDRVSPGDAEDPDWVAWFHAPTPIVLSNSENPLLFIKDSSWDIPTSYVGQPIESFSVVPGVSGGTPPYTFYKLGGPDWLTVRSDGVVFGTPTSVGINQDLEIMVRDNLGEMDTVTLYVDPTESSSPNPITKVYASSDINTVFGTGKPITAPSFTITDSVVPATIKLEESQCFWLKYDEEAHKWNKVDSGVFEASGKYVYRIRIFPEDPAYDFVNVSLEVDEVKWKRMSNAEDYAVFESEPFVAGTKIDKITVVNIQSPVVGLGLDPYGGVIKEEGMFLSDYFWAVEEGGSLVPCGDGDVFEEGKTYYINLTAAADPEKGFSFADTVEISVNGIVAPAVVITSQDAEEISFYCPIPFAVLSSNLYVVTAGALNVRDAASYHSGRIGGYAYGNVIQAQAESGQWVQVDYEGKTAWVNRNYLALTYTEETAIKPVKYKITAGAVNVRGGPHMDYERIGGLTYGKEVLVTGLVTNTQGEEWLVLDYEGEAGHQLGFVMKKYSYSESEVPGGQDPVEANSSSAEEDQETGEITVSTWTYPTVSFAPYKAAIAVGGNVELNDENYENAGDGYLITSVYPDDAKNFENLTKDKVKLPTIFTDKGLVVLDLTRQADGRIDLKIGPADPVTVTFDPDNGTGSKDVAVNKGAAVDKPADPEKEGFTFEGWYLGETLYDFSSPVTEAITLKARWKDNRPVTYTVVSGGNSTWTKGSGKTVTITVKRDPDDSLCFGQFTGVEIDGVALTSGTDFDAKAGSTVVTLKPAALQKLSVGSHTITLQFKDGTVQTGITVKAASGAPGTGDGSRPGLWLSLGLLSALGLGGIALSVKKRRSET